MPGSLVVLGSQLQQQGLRAPAVAPRVRRLRRPQQQRLLCLLQTQRRRQLPKRAAVGARQVRVILQQLRCRRCE